MYNTLSDEHDRYTFTTDIYAILVLGVRNFPDFRIPKQALINAFY